jgi:pyridoxine/pyridoxamine 5'-phosphate oxidase
MKPTLTTVKHLLDRTNLLTISSLAEDGRPQAAVIEFAATPELEIILDTYTTSRKYANLKRDPRTALVIGWDDRITVQYEGTATELSGPELDRCKDIYFEKNPRAKKWEHEPNITYIKISPHWLRYSDLNQRPWTIEEFKF